MLQLRQYIGHHTASIDHTLTVLDYTQHKTVSDENTLLS